MSRDIKAEFKPEAPRILIVCCAGSNNNLGTDSLIELWYKKFLADELFIKPTPNRPSQKDSKSSISSDAFLPSELVRVPCTTPIGPVDKLFLSGPGSDESDGVVTPGDESPVLGIRKSEVVDKMGLGWFSRLRKSFARSFYGIDTVHVNADSKTSKLVFGSALGGGRHDNVVKACTIVANAVGTDHQYEMVVTIGFSRGGVTAQCIGYGLHQMGIKTPVYTFAIDPVEGSKAGLLEAATHTICPNTALLYKVIARGDRTVQFFPQGPERDKFIDEATRKKVFYFEIEGTHSQAAGAPGENPLNTDCASAKGTEDLAMTFVREVEETPEFKKLVSGKNKKLLTNAITSQEMVEHYAYMQVFTEQFRYVLNPWNIKDAVYTEKTRPFVLKRPESGDLHHFFMNKRHKELFAEVHPEIYSKIQNNKLTLADIIAESNEDKDEDKDKDKDKDKDEDEDEDEDTASIESESIVSDTDDDFVSEVSEGEGEDTAYVAESDIDEDSVPKEKKDNDEDTASIEFESNEFNTDDLFVPEVSEDEEDIPPERSGNPASKRKSKLKPIQQIALTISLILRPLKLQMDQLSRQQYPCPDLIDELRKLEELASTAIAQHLHGEPANTSKNWMEDSLNTLPAVKICNSAAVMVETILDTRPGKVSIAEKHKAVSTFREDTYKFAPPSYSRLRQVAGKIAEAAVKLVGIIASVLGFGVGGLAGSYAVYEKTQQLSKNAYRMFAEPPAAKQARKLVDQHEKTVLRYE